MATTPLIGGSKQIDALMTVKRRQIGALEKMRLLGRHVDREGSIILVDAVCEIADQTEPLDTAIQVARDAKEERSA